MERQLYLTLSTLCPKFVPDIVRACTENLMDGFDENLYIEYWYGLVVPPLVWKELVPPFMVFWGASKIELC